MDIENSLTIQENTFANAKVFKAFFKNAPFPMMVLNTNAEFLAVNNAAVIASGYEQSELVGKKINILYKGLKSKIGDEHFLAVINKGKNFGEVPIRTKANEVIYYRVFAIKISENHILAISIDITKEKLALNELKRSESKYRKYIENAPVGHFIMDSKGRFIEVNNEASKQVNFPQSFILNNRAQDFFSPSNPNMGFDHMQKLFKEGKAEGDVMIRDADGKDHYYHMSGIKIEKDRYLLFSSNTTELRLAKQKLQESNEKLKRTNLRLKNQKKELQQAKVRAEESDKLKSAFLANMSHEIRTPMNAIIGFSEILKNEELTNEAKRYLDIICKRSDDLLQIIKDILDISKIEANQLTICKESFCLNTLLNETYESFSQNIKHKSPNISFKLLTCLSDSESYIHTDSIRLKQILGNLISNAIKFTESGEVEYGYRMRGKYLNFYVRDSGIGISFDQQQKIFERFHQVEKEATRHYGGTGLGLSISSHLVNMLGGRIWVESEIGFGSCFYFTIPFVRSNMGDEFEFDAKDSALNNSTFNWTGKSILIIEDDVINQEFLNEVLRSYNVKLLFAETGKKGLQCLNKRTNFDLVLLDILLPDIMGFEVAKELKRKRPDVPIIAQTAFALAEDKNKCLEAGCDDYISKPIDVNSLIKLIDKYLNSTN